MRNWDAAVLDLDRFAELRPDVPHPFFQRASALMQSARYEDAVRDLTHVIEMKENYFRETAYFYRAEAHLRLRHFDEALSDCGHVEAGLTFRYMFGHAVRSVADIEKEARSRGA